MIVIKKFNRFIIIANYESGKKLSCEVICTDNGKDGVEILRRERVNLVLLDIMMPEQDGIETLEKIRGDERLKKVSVMMLTAANGIENLKKVYTLGVKDYIKKPSLARAIAVGIGDGKTCDGYISLNGGKAIQNYSRLDS